MFITLIIVGLTQKLKKKAKFDIHGNVEMGRTIVSLDLNGREKLIKDCNTVFQVCPNGQTQPQSSSKQIPALLQT